MRKYFPAAAAVGIGRCGGGCAIAPSPMCTDASPSNHAVRCRPLFSKLPAHRRFFPARCAHASAGCDGRRAPRVGAGRVGSSGLHPTAAVSRRTSRFARKLRGNFRRPAAHRCRRAGTIAARAHRPHDHERGGAGTRGALANRHRVRARDGRQRAAGRRRPKRKPAARGGRLRGARSVDDQWSSSSSSSA